MSVKQRGRAGGFPPARPAESESQPAPVNDETASKALLENIGEDTQPMSPYGLQAPGQLPVTQIPREGVTVIGEAVRRVPPENAEFLIEITASALTAAQALRDNQSKTAQMAQAIGALGVQQTDIQTISLNVYNMYSPAMQGMPGVPGLPQIGPPGLSPFAISPYLQPEVQFGTYHARNILRVNVREPGRVGEVLDTATKAGATVSGSFSFQVSDEAGARRTLLEAAGRDARAKAETLAAAAGKQIGDPISITEDCIVSNGALTVLRQAIPLAFGAGTTPRATGELEYYARVSASFRFQ